MAGAAVATAFMTAEDYLAGENDGLAKREFVNGAVYAMVGSSDRHNLITLNLASFLSQRLPDRCQVFASDMKLRVRRARDERFYYPDVLVSCSSSDRADYWREEPVLIAEVLSPATERTDRGEKFEAYTSIPCLSEYVLVHQAESRAEMYRRRTGFGREIFTGDDAITFESLDLTLPVLDLYRRITL